MWLFLKVNFLWEDKAPQPLVTRVKKKNIIDNMVHPFFMALNSSVLSPFMHFHLSKFYQLPCISFP